MDTYQSGRAESYSFSMSNRMAVIENRWKMSNSLWGIKQWYDSILIDFTEIKKQLIYNLEHSL